MTIHKIPEAGPEFEGLPSQHLYSVHNPNDVYIGMYTEFSFKDDTGRVHRCRLSAYGARRVAYLLNQAADILDAKFVAFTEDGYEST